MYKFLRQKIGIIGCGNMGCAIAERVKNKYQVSVFDKDREKTSGLAGITVADFLSGLIKDVDIIILAVKPQDFDQVLKEIKDHAKDKLIISIAAGKAVKDIEKILGDARVIRTMPNLPAQIGEGITALAKGRYATDADLKEAENIFSCVGKVLVVDEERIDAITAVSGSGPAYVCNFLETGGLSLADIAPEKKSKFIDEFISAAQGVGFSREQAGQLVDQTYSGTILFLERNNIAPGLLRQRVASKGGTTEAALDVLSKGGSLAEAVKAAEKRAKELSRK